MSTAPPSGRVMIDDDWWKSMPLPWCWGAQCEAVTDVCSFILRYFFLATCLFLDCKIWLASSCHKAAPYTLILQRDFLPITWFCLAASLELARTSMWHRFFRAPLPWVPVPWFFNDVNRFSAGCGHPATLHAAGWWWHGGGAHGGCSTSICKWDMFKIICVCCCCCFFL